MDDFPATDMERRIANRIRVRRKLFGFSEQRIAFVMEMSLSEYRSIEDGERRITPCVLAELAWLFDVPVDYFFMT